MNAIRTTRRFVFLAIAALLVAGVTLSSHGYGDTGRSHSEAQCNLCQQLSGAAGVPAAPVVLLSTARDLLQPISFATLALPARRNVDSRLPRGPPFR